MTRLCLTVYHAREHLLSILQALLAGSYDPALADNPLLDYDDAAELHLLLDRLGPA